MNYWNYVAAIITFTLGVYLLYAAYKRRNRKHRHLRALAGVVAAGCLYLLYQYTSTGKADMAVIPGEIIILTEGASDDTLNYLQKLEPSAAIYTTDASIASLHNQAILVSQLDEIPGLVYNQAEKKEDSLLSSQRVTPVNTIHLLGAGLEPSELELLDSTTIKFYPTVLGSHFNSISWTRAARAGEKLIVQGSYNNSDKLERKIILQGFDTRLDSILIPPGSTTGFELQANPKQRGRAVYRLIVMAGKDTIQQEKIPFETIVSAPLNILMIASSPDFENKFLKNWLFSNSYGIAVRTTISTNKFNTEYLNLPGIKIETINSNLLNKFDLVIGDATALDQLNSGEVNSIRSAVEDQGLGLIIKMDSVSGKSKFYNSPFRYNQSNLSNSQLLHLQKQDTSASIPVLTAVRPLVIVKSGQLRNVISDKEGHVYSAITAFGSGKILSTTLANTFNWVLSGDTAAYRDFWSDLIAETSKRRAMPSYNTVYPAIPVADMPVSIMLESADSLPPVVRVNRSLVPLSQQYNLPFQWKGTFWPRKSGWQATFSADNQPYYWYCFGNNDWTDLRNHEKIVLNTLHSKADRNNRSTLETLADNGFDRNAKIYIIIMFIICCTYLWIEEKYHDSR